MSKKMKKVICMLVCIIAVFVSSITSFAQGVEPRVYYAICPECEQRSLYMTEDLSEIISETTWECEYKYQHIAYFYRSAKNVYCESCHYEDSSFYYGTYYENCNHTE